MFLAVAKKIQIFQGSHSSLGKRILPAPYGNYAVAIFFSAQTALICFTFSAETKLPSFWDDFSAMLEKIFIPECTL